MAKNKEKTGIKLLGVAVLVQLEAKKTVSEKGIFIPESVADTDDLKRATVISLGSGKLLDGKKHVFEVAEGDTVLIRGYGSDARIVRNGQEYVVVNEKDIVAIEE